MRQMPDILEHTGDAQFRTSTRSHTPGPHPRRGDAAADPPMRRSQHSLQRTLAMHKRNTMAAAAATAVGLGASTVAMAGTPFNTTGSGLPIVYNAKITNQVLALGPQWNPTHVLDTPPLKGGRYVVNYQVGAVIGRLDNVVCA